MQETHKHGCTCHSCGHSHPHEHEHHDHGCSCGHREEAHDHGCGCGCGHEHGSIDKADLRKTALRLGVAAALFAAALLCPNAGLKTALFAASWLTAGYRVLLQAGKNLLARALFDETFLMTVATVGAAAIGEWAEAAAVMVLFGLGELLEDIAVGSSRRSVESLLALKADTADLLNADGSVETVDPTRLCVGDHIVVRPFARVPTDGTVESGDCFVDLSALTGESVPVRKAEGDELLSGTVCGDSPLTVRVTAPYADSTAAKIIRLTQQTSANKAESEKFISRFARVYTPIVCGLALAAAVVPPLLGMGTFREHLFTALKFLVISCPCALVISVPLAYFAGMGCAARRGILIKGSAFMDTLRRADIAALDKTGTLTKGAFAVTRVLPADGFTENEVIALAAAAEQFSTHPIARSVTACAEGLTLPAAENAKELRGLGIEAAVEGKPLLVGSAALLEKSGIPLPDVTLAGTAVYVSLNGDFAGTLLLGDTPKPDAEAAVRALTALGVQPVMLTGDNETAARQTAEALGIRRVLSGLLPADKLAAVQNLQKEGHVVAFAGDGINDAPVLTAADAGLSMGGLGSDAAIEASDVVLLTDEPRKVADAIRICRRTHRIVLQNILFALGVKGGIMVLSFFGTPMWLAILADVGVALAAVLNATRALHVKE